MKRANKVSVVDCPLRRTFLVLLGLYLFLVQEVDGRKCPSLCTRDVSNCKSSGGKVIGYCVNGLACCDLTQKSSGTCGDTKLEKMVNFISPQYPEFSSKDLLCTFALKLSEESVGVKLEFLDVSMDGLGFTGNGASCDSDMFYFKGFKTWTPPPLCGNLTGYTTVIERIHQNTKMDQLHIVALMSSSQYRWKIKLSQITRAQVFKHGSSNAIPTSNSNSDGDSNSNNNANGNNYSNSNSPDNNFLNKVSTPIRRRLELDETDLLIEEEEGGGNEGKEELFSNPEFSELETHHQIKRESIQRKMQRTRQKSNKENSFNRRQRPVPAILRPLPSHLQIEPDAESIFVESWNDDEENMESGLEMPMIVNGEETMVSEVPWQVSLRFKYEPLANSNSTNSTSMDDEDGEDEESETDPGVDNNELTFGNGKNLSLTSTRFHNSTHNFTIYSNNNSSSSSNETVKVKETEVKRNCSAEEGSHFCGGTILHERFVLTAAHCFYGSSKLHGMEQLGRIKIVVGDSDTCTRDLPGNMNDTDTNKSESMARSTTNTNTNTTTTDSPLANDKKNTLALPQQEYEIETVIFHFAYDNVALLNDVALVKLSKPISFNAQVKEIDRLAALGESFDGKEAIASGFGMKNLTDKNAKLPYKLQSSHLFVVRNQSECNKENERLFGAPLKNVTMHPKYSTAFKSVLCTSSKNTTKGEVLVGPGDSGGPLVVTSESGENILIGIVSYGIPPEEPKKDGDYVDFFQSVAHFRSWINIAMAAAS